MTTPEKKRSWPGMVLLFALVLALGYLIIQMVLDNLDDPNAIGHALLILTALVVVASGLGWLVRRARR